MPLVCQLLYEIISVHLSKRVDVDKAEGEYWLCKGRELGVFEAFKQADRLEGSRLLAWRRCRLGRGACCERAPSRPLCIWKLGCAPLAACVMKPGGAATSVAVFDSSVEATGGGSATSACGAGSVAAASPAADCVHAAGCCACVGSGAACLGDGGLWLSAICCATAVK